MTFEPALLDHLRDQINTRLSRVYANGPPLLEAPIRYALAGKGKRLRPILTMLTCQACGGERDHALHAAVAVELLHNFTLVHDDIMDHDQTRHGQTTVHEKWDEGVGILSGDALFVIALKELRCSETGIEDLTTAFLEGALAVCEGQALDKEFESRDGVSMDEYMTMVDLKTGYMLGLSSELGAICASADASQLAAVREFGCLLGRAFQIQDDMLEIYSDARTMGKSLGSDILAEKKTYLLISALEKIPEKVTSVMELTQNDLQAGMNAMQLLLEEEGIRNQAEAAIRANVAAAKERLSPLSTGAKMLEDFAELVLQRSK
jgi:geranylgeranyl diphosphate synthase type II